MIPNQTKSRQPSSDKTRNQSKSKISYYLSKSNFNDTSTLGDTTINQLSVINGMWIENDIFMNYFKWYFI
jgi:hypothetical protein